MKACTRCPYPVTAKDATPDPDVPGKVMHKICPDRPAISPRKGKLHPAAMRTMRLAKVTGDQLRLLKELRNLVERGNAGTDEALRVAIAIQSLATETTTIVREAIDARVS